VIGRGKEALKLLHITTYIIHEFKPRDTNPLTWNSRSKIAKKLKC